MSKKNKNINKKEVLYMKNMKIKTKYKIIIINK